MLVAVGLLFPLLLLGLMLLMDRVERPLRAEDMRAALELFLDTARPDEVEAYVSEGYARSLDRYWRSRHRVARVAAAGRGRRARLLAVQQAPVLPAAEPRGPAVEPRASPMAAPSAAEPPGRATAQASTPVAAAGGPPSRTVRPQSAS